jgi:nitrogen fixation/metabolism regulation signal transduction histidine kinase
VWQDLASAQTAVEAFYVAAIVALCALVLGMLVSVLLSRRVTDPVLKLARAAEAVQAGDYDLGILDTLSGRQDEFGHLSQTFRDMVTEVRGREQRLREQVQELKIEIDRASQAREVSQIVDSEYFQTLRSKVKAMRKPDDHGV